MVEETNLNIRLDTISDFDMAYCELSEDNLFDLIPEEKRKQYIRQSMKIATDMAAIYQGTPIWNLFDKYQVEVNLHQEEVAGAIHSQIYYDGNIKKVDVFLSVLKDMKQAMQAVGYEVTMEELINLHLAHEFYHFLEFYQDRRTYEQLEPLTYKMFGFIKRTACVRRTSEISAHMFAKQVNDFPIHPKVLDYILLQEQRDKKDLLFDKLQKMHIEQGKEVSF